MTINGIHLLAAIVAIVAIYLTVHYLEWRHWDKDRRMHRRVRVNLHRTMRPRA